MTPPNRPAPRLREIVTASAKEIPGKARPTAWPSASCCENERIAHANTSTDWRENSAAATVPAGRGKGMAHMLLGLLPAMVIADLGAGEGTLSQLLARTARQVIAVDNSEKMVEFGAALAREHGFSNLEYRLGDIQIAAHRGRTASISPFSAKRYTTQAQPEPGRSAAAHTGFVKPGGRLVDTRPARTRVRAGAGTLRRPLARLQRVGTAPVPRKRAGFEDIVAVSVVSQERNKVRISRRCWPPPFANGRTSGQARSGCRRWRHCCGLYREPRRASR